MCEILRRYTAHIVKLYHKPIVDEAGWLDVIFVHIFFDGYKLLRSYRYDIYWNKIHVGRLNIIFGTNSKVINTFGNVGIEIFTPYRKKGIGLSCINYSIQILLKKQRKCKIISKSSNIPMQKILEKTKYKMMRCKEDYCYYEYAK